MDKTAEILNKTKTIAVIGMKVVETEDAYKIPYYMHLHGYRIIPVNPKLAGKKIFGNKAVNNVNEVKEKVDTVNIFRKPEYLVEHAKEILNMKPLPKYVWFQLGIYNDMAAGLLEGKGIKVVQNRCIMVEHTNL